MAKKRRTAHQGQIADSAAYAAPSKDGKSVFKALQAFGREEIVVEVEPGRFVNVRLSSGLARKHRARQKHRRPCRSRLRGGTRD
jgi:hypothetical protein